MAKIFELTVFLNFVVAGIALGYSGWSMNHRRIVLLMVVYIAIYTAFGLIVLSDIGFLVPEP